MNAFCRYALVLLLLAGCGEDEIPQVEFVGGGFVLNYRQAEMTYGFVARIKGEVPEGSVLEAVFEDPAGGPPIVIRQEIMPTRSSYKFETPPVEGVRKDHDYQVELRLLASQETAEAVIARSTRSYSSQVGAETVPEQPLAVGPGYHRPDGSAPTLEAQESQ